METAKRCPLPEYIVYAACTAQLGEREIEEANVTIGSTPVGIIVLPFLAILSSHLLEATSGEDMLNEGDEVVEPMILGTGTGVVFYNSVKKEHDKKV